MEVGRSDGNLSPDILGVRAHFCTTTISEIRYNHTTIFRTVVTSSSHNSVLRYHQTIFYFYNARHNIIKLEGAVKIRFYCGYKIDFLRDNRLKFSSSIQR